MSVPSGDLSMPVKTRAEGEDDGFGEAGDPRRLLERPLRFRGCLPGKGNRDVGLEGTEEPTSTRPKWVWSCRCCLGCKARTRERVTSPVRAAGPQPRFTDGETEAAAGTLAHMGFVPPTSFSHFTDQEFRDCSSLECLGVVKGEPHVLCSTLSLSMPSPSATLTLLLARRDPASSSSCLH
ncbi:putative uncharacterized protein FLJ37218 [Symphalangus syndactylus]|uniref:putative uncharacterized protein FLJ37218 n=1 Tax=Symphalangus syndactylus TaxID=9590 RepID=UPI002442290A|nr:putative uncharacterized protein FLJ37218 [Symphalangus syndactylus]